MNNAVFNRVNSSFCWTWIFIKNEKMIYYQYCIIVSKYLLSKLNLQNIFVSFAFHVRISFDLWLNNFFFFLPISGCFHFVLCLKHSVTFTTNWKFKWEELQTPNTYCFILLVTFCWNLMKEGKRETCEAIKTLLYYYENSILSLKEEKLPRAKIATFQSEV